MAERNVPEINRQKCTICGLCVDACPEDVLAIEDSSLILANASDCTMCAECESVCPEQAVSVHYRISWAKE